MFLVYMAICALVIVAILQEIRIRIDRKEINDCIKDLYNLHDGGY